MTFVSFFAGIGGIDLGLERAGHECVGQVEINPFCQRVLAKHWPGTWRHDDITTLKPEDIPSADLWAGGFPCQDISNAGKRAGIHGARSGLFFDFMRLVREVRPRYLLLENVAALLSVDESGEAPMATVLSELAESRYDAEWRSIHASDVGACHPRNRIFILAYRSRDDVSDKRQQPQTRRDPILSQQPRRIPRWPSYAGIRRGNDAFPDRMDRLKALGNAVVPQVAEYIGKLLAKIEIPVDTEQSDG